MTDIVLCLQTRCNNRNDDKIEGLIDDKCCVLHEMIEASANVYQNLKIKFMPKSPLKTKSVTCLEKGLFTEMVTIRVGY